MLGILVSCMQTTEDGGSKTILLVLALELLDDIVDETLNEVFHRPSEMVRGTYRSVFGVYFINA